MPDMPAIQQQLCVTPGAASQHRHRAGSFTPAPLTGACRLQAQACLHPVQGLKAGHLPAGLSVYAQLQQPSQPRKSGPGRLWVWPRTGDAPGCAAGVCSADPGPVYADTADPKQAVALLERAAAKRDVPTERIVQAYKVCRPASRLLALTTTFA